jgi:hypothetical protein
MPITEREFVLPKSASKREQLAPWDQWLEFSVVAHRAQRRPSASVARGIVQLCESGLDEPGPDGVIEVTVITTP